MQRFLLFSGTLLAAIGVILGAFGAHALKAKLTAEQLQIFQTGIHYHFYHAIGILFAGLLLYKIDSPLVSYAGISFIIGILFFSGSLYLLATSSITGLDSYRSILGPITPLGGLSFIIGWILLAVDILKTKTL